MQMIDPFEGVLLAIIALYGPQKIRIYFASDEDLFNHFYDGTEEVGIKVTQVHDYYELVINPTLSVQEVNENIIHQVAHIIAENREHDDMWMAIVESIFDKMQEATRESELDV